MDWRELSSSLHLPSSKQTKNISNIFITFSYSYLKYFTMLVFFTVGFISIFIHLGVGNGMTPLTGYRECILSPFYGLIVISEGKKNSKLAFCCFW